MKARFRMAPIALILAFPTQALAQYDDLSGAEKTEERTEESSSGGNRFGLGARFLWVVHSTSRSDLGVGAGVGVSHRENDGPGDATAFHGEGLVQLRFFVVSNVAIHAGLGIGFSVGDEESLTVLSIGGQLLGSLGLSYFFD